MTTTRRPRRGRRDTVFPPRYIGSALGLLFGGLFIGGLLTPVLYEGLPWLVGRLAPSDTILMWRFPGPFAGWMNLWLWLAGLWILFMLPREWSDDRKIRRRSRKVDSFVLWRVNGLFELHRPEGGVVPVYDFRLSHRVLPDEVEEAQWCAAAKVHQLTGRRVDEWEPDKAGRSAHADSSWIAHLGEEATRPREHPREGDGERLARLRTLDIWMKFGTRELEKLAAGETFHADYPPCPVCRGWVAHFESDSDDSEIGVTFDPCGCRYAVEKCR